jgi:hypothetical protein
MALQWLPLPRLGFLVLLLSICLWMVAPRVMIPASSFSILRDWGFVGRDDVSSVSMRAHATLQQDLNEIPTHWPSAEELADAHPELDRTLLLRAARLCSPITHTCSRALTWEELKVMLVVDQRRVCRAPEVAEVYLERRAQIAAEYRTPGDHIRATKFGAACTTDDANGGKKVCEFEANEDLSAAESFALDLQSADPHTMPLPASFIVANDFPYSVQKGIAHEVVWLRVVVPPGPHFAPLVARIVESHRPSSRFDTVHLVNAPAWQTIPDVFHIHVFSRARE